MNLNSLSFFSICKLLLLVGVCLILTTCKNDKINGAVVFSFDDQYIEEWFAQRELFQKYNIRATFFISRPHLLTPEKINKLKILQNDGHEIGCHGLNHLNVVEYKDSINILIEKEIKPAIKILSDMGFEILSFAHPYGQSLPEINLELLKYFEFLRMATWNVDDTTIEFYNEIYADKDNYNVINSMGIDTNYRISLENFKQGLCRTKKNKEVLILYAHNINTSLANYTISPEYLERSFKLCKKLNISTIRLCDLEDYFAKKLRL